MILKNLFKYQEYYFELDEKEDTKSELLALGGICDEFPDDEQSTGDKSPHIGDDVCLEDLTDKQAAELSKPCRRCKSFAVRRNAKGETQLHVACILGFVSRMVRLLVQGHPANARDYAGWTPLHEACIHGNFAAAHVLLHCGANINDRGGAICNGITPLHVAACNGHLEVVKLLLEKRVKPYLKNDFGETPLIVLQKWKTGKILTEDKEVLYNNICNKIHNFLDKTMPDKSPVKAIQIESAPSTSKISNNIKQLDSSALKRRNVIDDSSDDDDYSNTRNQTAIPSDSNSEDEISENKEKVKSKRSGNKEYINAIRALKNKNLDIPEVEIKTTETKSALLHPSEIDNDWLEDDMGTNRTRKCKLNNPLTTLPKRSFIDSLKTTIDSLNEIDPFFNDMSKTKSRIGDNERNEHISDSYHLSSNSSSDNETNIREKEQNLSSGRPYDENINYSNSDDNCNIVQSMNPNIVLPMNVSKPICILQSKDSRPKQTQIPGAVKVNIKDKMLLIALKVEKINNLTISWLVEEVKSRYYKLTGVRPLFILMTSDGAILSEEDPLSLVLSTPELHTCMITFKASPNEERYLECCEALEIRPSEEIQQVVGRSHTTRRLALGSSTLSSTQIRPLFRSLTHQTHITVIMIADNNIQDDGMKYLADSICTMKHLTVLDIGNNNITSEGVKTLVNAFEKTRNNCQSLENIDLSGNKISDDGFKSVLTLSRHLKLRILKLNSCGITGNIANEVTKFDMNFDTLETLHMSHNAIKQRLVNCMMQALNPNVLCDLELDNIDCQGTIVGCISNFMSNAKDLKVRRLSLSDCKLTDGPFKFFLRCLERSKYLHTITFKNNQLTFFTLMRLLQRQPAVPQINLEGCQDIFKYSPDLDLKVWLPTINFGRCIPIINVTPICKTHKEKESLKMFSKIWLSCFKGRGMIEHGSGGLIKFTASCNNVT